MTVAFPQPSFSARDLPDLIAFADDHKALAFLYMPYTGPALRQETILDTTDGITTDGIATTWAFNHKYLRAASVKVYLDGVEQTAGWSLVGNNSAPTVVFSVAPTTGQTLMIVSDFLVPVIFKKTPMETGQGITDAKDPDADSPQSFKFEFIETEPGARWVNATGMSGA